MAAPSPRSQNRTFLAIFVASAIGTLVVAAVLVTMFDHKQEARQPFVRVAEIDEVSTDSVPWGKNWPHQFDGWKATAGDRFDGGSSAMPQSKLDRQPWLKRLYAGYAFSLDYREARGHAYMLYDQGVTERVTKKPQAGACLHCHGSVTVLYRKIGLEAMGQDASAETLAEDFHMDAVRRGFAELSQRPYQEVLALLHSMPDGTPDKQETFFPTPPPGGFSGEFAGKPIPEDHGILGEAHPVGCIDCHDPKSMGLRITRPGFMDGIAALAAGEGDASIFPSIERWRAGDRGEAYDPNQEATRQEMRSFVCAQCHVEYYCASKDVLEFPWSNGLAAEDLEAHWDAKTLPDGSPFIDYQHKETGARIYKVQHPEFELWSRGIHARSGVSCADCHMPYERVGAMKVSSHDVRSPVENLQASCQTCHNVPEADLRARIETIQGTTLALLDRAADAMTDMLDAIRAAQATDLDPAALAPLLELQRAAMWRIDYISSENSRGFHADQEAARILAESIDLSRQAEAMAHRLRAPAMPDVPALPGQAVIGVTGADEPKKD